MYMFDNTQQEVCEVGMKAAFVSTYSQRTMTNRLEGAPVFISAAGNDPSLGERSIVATCKRRGNDVVSAR